MILILWLIAVVLVITGVRSILQKQLVPGVILIVVGFLVGPGGASIFT